MNCSEVREIIQLYMDNELGSRDTLNVQRHLEACSACSHVLDMFLKQDRLLRQEARAHELDSHQLRERILVAIRGQAQHPLNRLSAHAVWNVPSDKASGSGAVFAIAATLLLSRPGCYRVVLRTYPQQWPRPCRSPFDRFQE
jgi:anti-sigma factor RsiW